MARTRGRLGFIGAGNMGQALIRGLIESGRYLKEDLSAADRDPSVLEAVSGAFGVTAHPSGADLADACRIVVLSVKPQDMRRALLGIRDHLRDDHLLISIAAGIPLRVIRETVRKDIPMIRVMPNTPALIREGISALAGDARVTDDHMAAAGTIFGAVGETVVVTEEMMDAVTAVSGSGPGYVFRIMECMADAGVAAGLSPETALALVVQTFVGAARLAKTSDQSLSRLREMVTSPGGTTAAGLAVLDGAGLAETIRRAVAAAADRSRALGKDA